MQTSFAGSRSTTTTPCFKDGNREHTDIHEAVKHELVKMVYAAGCRKISVEPRASDTGNDRADIEIRDFSKRR